MEYLKGLSYDTVPYMEKLVGDEDLAEEVLVYFRDKSNELEDQSHWQSLNLSRIKASRLLDKYVK